MRVVQKGKEVGNQRVRKTTCRARQIGKASNDNHTPQGRADSDIDSPQGDTIDRMRQAVTETSNRVR
ncbi:hypothetical protein XELAEV_18001345mg [Xenopus laevis]|nr:hypothetical protein XELAEV_18001345mg [Xenopus laevis]